MRAAPPISVYMPAFNVAPYVRQAVTSVLEQTLGDYEFVIIDDGSTDGTREILLELAEKDRRIRLFSRPNIGVSATANQAIALCRGEFLARMDGDDIALPMRLEQQLHYMRLNKPCVALGAGVLLIDDAGLPLYPMPDLQQGHERIDAALLRAGWPILQTVCMFRRDAVMAAGGYRTHLSLHEDHDMFLRLAERGRLENLPQTLQWYRQRFSSLTFSEAASSRQVLEGILHEARQRRGLDEQGKPVLTPRPSPATRRGALSRYRQWAWMSLKAHHVRTARKYARAAVKLAPFSSNSWRLLYCAWRGR